MAGHSKWSNIKHRKGRQDALRGKANTRLIREVMVAAKAGGADRATNASLRLASERASKANVTKDAIERAILKATGQLQGEEMFELSYEGYGPNGVAIWLQCMTDNKNRTVAEVRHAFSKYNGTLGTSGTVAYLFERVARLVVADVSEDDVMEAVLEHAVNDIVSEDNMTLILADPSELNAICETLSAKNWQILESEVTYLPTADIELDQDAGEKVDKLIQALEELDDVQAVYHNLKIMA
ncbi:YebC/PmpR family DNA-binding transcriptional regulator [Candidatus Synchoanobacter obligatus]|uniref:Probable transcriptional regulatory protein MKS91_03365 n=1 Tax=Candidatus Synchoanobacter obligatus TaxID=2919597 RepID=A0ABT1L5W3_9GAMM|nr:YebC/PmpR family DNA-binding transcriptional regulator [Candidatus Synchoanobacter obligatus]MCP8352326.1 YebC/PmpR family DNA-binding transcriptional regulator [Candidatus Synchoanobacter obligatus]